MDYVIVLSVCKEEMILNISMKNGKTQITSSLQWLNLDMNPLTQITGMLGTSPTGVHYIKGRNRAIVYEIRIRVFIIRYSRLHPTSQLYNCPKDEGK